MTGLRFFTVYGPWGRPDMAMFLFAKAICEGEPIRLFNYGRMRRDFTYVDDVVEAMERLIGKPPKKASGELAAAAQDPASSAAPWRIYNIGNNDVVDISRVVALLERELGRKAKTELVPMQPGDVARPGQTATIWRANRLPAFDADRSGDRPVHCLVSRVSRYLMSKRPVDHGAARSPCAAEAESIHIMREVVAQFAKPVMLYSIGKDTSVMLHLAIKAFWPSKPPFPLLHIDTTWKFKEMIAFRDRRAAELGLDLIVHTNEDGRRAGVSVHPRIVGLHRRHEDGGAQASARQAWV